MMNYTDYDDELNMMNYTDYDDELYLWVKKYNTVI